MDTTKPTIKLLNKPDLQIIKMKCDNVIDKKLLEYPMVADCFSKNHFTIIIGMMGQGKTTLAINLIKNVMKKCYEHIYIIMTNVSRSSIDNDILGKTLPEDQIYDDLNENVLNELYQKLEDNSLNYKENSLILIDDFQERFKDTDIQTGLEKIIIKLRHLRVTVILLQQNYFKLTKNLRELVFNLIFFNLGKSQLEKIFDEVIQKKKNKYNDLIQISFIEPHDWICINTKSNKYYKMFDEIIL